MYAIAIVGLGVCLLHAAWAAGTEAPDDERTAVTAGRQPADRPGVDPTVAADRAIETALARTLPELAFDQVPLSRVLDWFREVLGVNMHVYWTNLADCGVDPDSPVSVNVRDLSAERALRLVLDAVSDYAVLGFQVDDGVLVIATRDRLNRASTTEVYDVRDLLLAAATRPGVRATTLGKDGLPPLMAKPPGPMSPGALPAPTPPANEILFPDPARDNETPSAEEMLMSLIVRTVEPDSWAGGGGEGRQSVFNGVLVVYQRPDVHRQIGRLLADLRRAGAVDVR